MAIYIEPMAVENVSTFTFDRYASNLTNADIERMQESSRLAYAHYADTNVNMANMVKVHNDNFITDEALNRAKELMKDITETIESKDFMYIDKDNLSKATGIMRDVIASHPTVIKRVNDKTMSPMSNSKPDPILYKEVMSGLNSSKRKLVITQTTRRKVKSLDKIEVYKTYSTLLNNIDDIEL